MAPAIPCHARGEIDHVRLGADTVALVVPHVRTKASSDWDGVQMSELPAGLLLLNDISARWVHVFSDGGAVAVVLGASLDSR